ncbi:MAG TPA: glycosyltransferase 61 family protein, partial [Acetobacteraceae bacterium]|nr:glycosyltransferase 61 family protein [Acetobacteraceae bacterium]
TEQIRLFRNAGVVVGPHGGGLTSIAFCDPGTIVYELVPAQAPNPSFCNLAHSAGLHYWADRFGETAAGEADIPTMLRRLDEIEAIRAQLLEAAQQRTISAMDFLRGRPGVVSPVQAEQAAPVQARQGWFRRRRGGPRQGG